MRKLIYLYQNYQINKISLIFMLVSIFIVYYVSYSIIDFDINKYLYLSEYKNIVGSYFFELYTVVELIVVLFVVVLSFMELFNNGYLFDILFINPFGKDTVITCKLLSYLLIIFTYIIILFCGISIITIDGFKESFLIKDLVVMFLYILNEATIILLFSLILIKLFRNYFANFIILILFIVKRVLYESIELDKCTFLLNLELGTSITCQFNILPTIIVPFLLVIINIIVYQIINR